MEVGGGGLTDGEGVMYLLEVGMFCAVQKNWYYSVVNWGDIHWPNKSLI